MSGYLMRLICAAVICALIRSAAGDAQGIRRLVCGMFLILTVLSAPVDLELPEVETDRITRDVRAAVQAGELQAETAREAIINEAFKAYIWNKAAAMDLDLEVRMELGKDQIPDTVMLTGNASASEKTRIICELVRELGIGEEDVIWIQPHQSNE